MTLSTIQEITEVIKMPEAEFRESVLPLADAQRRASFSDALSVRAMIGYSNICKNRCLPFHKMNKFYLHSQEASPLTRLPSPDQALLR